MWRVTLEKVQPQHLNAIGEQIVATKQCQDKLHWPSPVPSYFFFKSKAAFQDHLLKAECATAARLGGKDKPSSYD